MAAGDPWPMVRRPDSPELAKACGWRADNEDDGVTGTREQIDLAWSLDLWVPNLGAWEDCKRRLLDPKLRYGGTDFHNVDHKSRGGPWCVPVRWVKANDHTLVPVKLEAEWYSQSVHTVQGLSYLVGAVHRDDVLKHGSIKPAIAANAYAVPMVRLVSPGEFVEEMRKLLVAPAN